MLPRELENYSLSSVSILDNLSYLGSKVRNIEGDIVECGVLNGGSAAAIAHGLPGRKLWLYDSFSGMPNPTSNDPKEAWDDVGLEKLNGDPVVVEEALKIVQANDYLISIGWFENTFKFPKPEKVAYLHIDCDWYESVMLSLQTFYPIVSQGGIIVLDDFGHWEGCRKAFYQWVQVSPEFPFFDEYPLIERFGHSQAYWIKGKKNNRDYIQ